MILINLSVYFKGSGLPTPLKSTKNTLIILSMCFLFYKLRKKQVKINMSITTKKDNLYIKHFVRMVVIYDHIVKNS